MTVFWIVGIVGTLVLVVSLVFGDLLDGVLDVLDAANGILSTTVLGGFAAAFGFTGALADSLGAPTAVAALAGVAAGVVAAWFAIKLTGALQRSESGLPLTGDDLVGVDAVVITRIPANGYGEVRLAVAGNTLKLNARADLPLEPGSTVYVTESLSSSAVHVTPA